MDSIYSNVLTPDVLVLETRQGSPQAPCLTAPTSCWNTSCIPTSAPCQPYLLQAEDAFDKACGGPGVVECHGEVAVDLLLLWPVLLTLDLPTAMRPLGTGKLTRRAVQGGRAALGAQQVWKSGLWQCPS